jgi:hypothetical protein
MPGQVRTIAPLAPMLLAAPFALRLVLALSLEMLSVCVPLGPPSVSDFMLRPPVIETV